MKNKQPKRRSGTAQAAQHRKAGPHGNPLKAYKRHPKHKGQIEYR